MGVNPEDPAAMASIQRVASTFFNAIDKKEGSPYVFQEGKQSFDSPPDGFEQSEPSVDSDQEELDRFIAEIEDAADKEYEVEEAKENEEIGRIRYRNRDEFGGKFIRSDAYRNDDYNGQARNSRFRQTTNTKHGSSDSDDESNISDDDYHTSNVVYDNDSDLDSNNSSEAKGRFKAANKVDREKRKNFGKAQVNESLNRHTGGKFSRNRTAVDSESESMLSDLENTMWASDEEENGSPRQFSDYRRSNSDDKYAHHMRRDKKNGARDCRGNADESEDTLSDLENTMWRSSDSEEDSVYTQRGGKKNERNVVKNDNNHKRNPKEEDEAWDSD